jgi:hypothetical protein
MINYRLLKKTIPLYVFLVLIACENTNKNSDVVTSANCINKIDSGKIIISRTDTIATYDLDGNVKTTIIKR